MPGYGNPYMNYNYQNPYQAPYYQQYQTQMPMVQNPPMQTAAQAPAPAPVPVQNVTPSTINWVSDEKEASMWPVAPNGAVALWDQTSPVIYLKQADASGKPAMKVFDLVERVEQSQNAASGSGVDVSHFAEKSDVAALAGIVSDVRKDIEAIKDEMGNLASQAVKRAVGAKPKKEAVQEDDD